MSHSLPQVQTIREQIANNLRADILSGHFPKGSPLREQSLAERFGVSRGPIRDVFLQLTQQGMLVSVPNCGVRVSDEPSKWVQPLIVKMRLEIETFALRHCIEAITDKDIARLEKLVEKLGVACKDGDYGRLAEADIAFHKAILECSRDTEIVSVWLPIVTRMIMHYTRHKDMTHSIKEHTEILDAIRAKDIERAVTALSANIQ